MTKQEKDLRAIFSGVIDLDVDARITALKKAVVWYEMLIPSHRLQFTPDEEAKFQKSLSTKNLGFGAGTPKPEAETALLMTLRLFARIMARFGVGSSVSIDMYYQLYAERKAELEAKDAKLRVKYAPILDALSRAYGGELGLTFKVRAGAAKARQFDGDGNIVFSTEYCDDLLKLRDESGIFAVVMGEIFPLVLKAASISRDAKGGFIFDAAKMAEASVKGARLMVRFVDSLGATVKPAVPVNREEAKPAAVKNIWYRGKMAEIFELIAGCEGTIHIDEIRRRVAAADVTRMVSFIAAKGAATGQWRLSKFRNGWIDFQWTR